MESRDTIKKRFYLIELEMSMEKLEKLFINNWDYPKIQETLKSITELAQKIQELI